ncbi:MAG: helix-turn-helix transcriptional regulator [Phycisphaerae bacterium]
MKPQDLIGMVRKAIAQDDRTLYRIAKDAGLPYATVHRFARAERTEISATTLARLCAALGLELRPIERKGK